MLAVQRGDSAAFRTLFDRHADAIRGYLAARVGMDAAEDLVSETFVAAWQARGRFRADADSERPWLYGIATVMVSRHREAEARWLQAARRETEQPPHSSSAAPEVSDLRGPVMRALAELRPGERDVLLLTAFADASPRDVARTLGISHVAARVRLSRARSRLATALRSELTGDAE